MGLKLELVFPCYLVTDVEETIIERKIDENEKELFMCCSVTLSREPL